jgi:hypothetical protein
MAAALAWRQQYDELNEHFLNAVKYHDVDKVEKYIEAGCDVNIQNNVRIKSIFEICRRFMDDSEKSFIIEWINCITLCNYAKTSSYGGISIGLWSEYSSERLGKKCHNSIIFPLFHWNIY